MQKPPSWMFDKVLNMPLKNWFTNIRALSCAVKRKLISLRYCICIGISKHIPRRVLFYVAASRVLFVHLTPALFFRTPSNIQDGVLLRNHLTTLDRWLFAQKHSISDVWKGSKYVFVQIAPDNVLGHHNKHLMVYFEFLHVSRIICLHLNISEKLHWHHLFEKQEEAETHRLHLSKYDAIPTHPEEQYLSFKPTETITSFFH